MKKINIFLATGFIILATIFIQSCSKSDVNDNPPPGGGGPITDTVTIQATIFAPFTMTVGLGATVTWKNTDTETHSVVADDGSFSSGDIAPNETYSFSFTSNRSYPYHCGLHPAVTGAVQVMTR